MDRETLKFLAAGGHMNMPERISRGLWPHPPITRKELLAAVAEAISEQEWFPRRWEPSSPGEPVKEGGVVERQAPDRYVYRAQASKPSNPGLLHRPVEVVFRTAAEAAAWYIRWDLPPHDLDGWLLK
jgi:hypothetical protein